MGACDFLDGQKVTKEPPGGGCNRQAAPASMPSTPWTPVYGSHPFRAPPQPAGGNLCGWSRPPPGLRPWGVENFCLCPSRSPPGFGEPTYKIKTRISCVGCENQAQVWNRRSCNFRTSRATGPGKLLPESRFFAPAVLDPQKESAPVNGGPGADSPCQGEIPQRGRRGRVGEYGRLKRPS